jgi:hypothetical protein
MKVFCRDCGRECKVTENIEFDPATGERKVVGYWARCPRFFLLSCGEWYKRVGSNEWNRCLL